MHDPATFNKYVDVAGAVSQFTDDLIFEPAQTTENLTRFQQVVGLGALGMSKNPIDNTMIFQVQKWLQRKRVHKKSLSVNDSLNDEDESDEEDYEEDNLSSLEEPPTLKEVLKKELKFEIQKLKDTTRDRMIAYAKQNPETLVNKIFVAPQGKKRNSFKQILRHYGFTGKNIRKVEVNPVNDKYVCTLYFFSPIINDVVPVHFELARVKSSTLPYYRIKRIIKVKECFLVLGEDTDDQVQGLVKHGLKDLSLKSTVSETKDFLKRIKGRACQKK